MEKITHLELFALLRWRRSYGHGWKSELRKAWGNHCYGGIMDSDRAALHGLRNRLGPVWLDRFRFPPGSA
jgi:hypothetical protein